jgi:hypothetical protein
LTLPCEFSFETGCNNVHSIAISNAFIHPCILPAEFWEGRLVQSTFEYYKPNMMARQLGCGQVPPRLFLHEFLKPRENIKESMQARRIFEYKCSTTFYAPRPFVSITLSHPSFIPWWQEFHDHIFNVLVHPLCLELMPDFQPTSEVICSSPFLTSVFNHIPLYWLWFCHFLQDIVHAPLARTISYNIEGPISALGCRSPTLAQLMSRYTTLDPTLIRPASDKRKAPSLIASPTVKMKRISKKLLIQVRKSSPPEHNVIYYSDHLYLRLISDQNSTTTSHYKFCQCFIYW